MAAARRARRDVWFGFGAILLGYCIPLVALFVVSSEDSGLAMASLSPAPAVMVVLVAAAERRRIEEAAGRTLLNSEFELIADSTAAGVVVDDPDLVVPQELFARRHVSVVQALVLGVVLTCLTMILPVLALLTLPVSPVVLVISAFLVLGGSLYGSLHMVRRAAGAEATTLR